MEMKEAMYRTVVQKTCRTDIGNSLLHAENLSPLRDILHFCIRTSLPGRVEPDFASTARPFVALVPELQADAPDFCPCGHDIRLLTGKQNG